MIKSATLDLDRVDGRSRPRARTDAKIAEAVMELVQTLGPAAVTIEAVSTLSGVARTTLYRRYKDRYDLLAAFAEQIVPLPAVPERVGREGFTQLIRGFQETFESKVGMRLVGHMLASGDEFLAGWRERVMYPRLAGMRQFFEQGVAEGIVRADRDPHRVIEIIAGAVIFTLVVHGRFPDGWAEDLSDTLWPTIAA